MNRLGFFQIILFAVIAFCSSASAYSQTENTDNLQVVDKVIAVVGQNMVKESELETAYLQQKSNRGIIEDAFMVRCDLFEGMLINELMLHQAEKDSRVASDEMVTFLVLNTAGVTILPTTVMAIRQKYGSVNPADFLLLAFVGTLLSCIGGLLLDKLFRKFKKKN